MRIFVVNKVNMLIIGSTALKYHYPEFSREPKDLDLVVEKVDNHHKIMGVEFLENPVLLQYQKEGILSTNLLFTLKISHLFWDINWSKHLYDVIFLRDKGCIVDKTILNQLIDYWTLTKPKVRRSELAMTKEDFFTNNVNENVEEHDYLHTLINPEPMFTRLLKDGAEVELDENKWDELSFEDKKAVVFEEVGVMQYERYNGKLHFIPAFRRQLQQCIIRHFPRYISIFAILNYPELETPKINYTNLINEKLSI